MADGNGQKRSIKILVGVLALFKIGLAIFAWLDKDPKDPVTWGEMRIILLIEAIVVGLIAWKLLFYNFALYG
jgi:hypothetical protein